MNENISLATVVRASRDQVHAEVEDECVILHLKNGVYYGLDPVGTRIWQLIQQPTSVSEVVDTVLAEFEVEREQCGRDTLKLLNELAAENLIEVLNP